MTRPSGSPPSGYPLDRLRVLVRYALPSYHGDTVTPSGPWFYGLSTGDGWTLRWGSAATADTPETAPYWAPPDDASSAGLTRPLPPLPHPRLSTIYADLVEVPPPPAHAAPIVFADLYRARDDEPAVGSIEVIDLHDGTTVCPTILIQQYTGSAHRLGVYSG